MPVDSNIAMGYRGVDIQNPLNAFAQMQQIQAAQQGNQLNQMRMAEMQRGITDQNNLRAMLSGFAPGMKVDDQVNALTRGGFLDPARKLAESHAKVGKDARDAEKAKFEVAKLKREDLSQRLRDIAADPSDTRIGTHLQAILDNPIYDDSDKATVIKDVEGILGMPIPQRASMLSKFGASATDLKPQNFAQNLGGTLREMQVGPTGTASVVPGSEAPVTMTEYQRGQLSQGAQNTSIANQRLELEKQRLEQTRVNPEGLAPKDMAKREAGHPQAKLALTTLDQKTDDLVKQLKELKTHKGLSNITGGVAGRLPSVSAAGTGAQALLDTIISKGQIGVMQALKDASATGATGFGAMSEKENKVVRDSFGVLQQTQSTPDFQKRLDEVIEQVEQTRKNMRQSFEDTYAYKAGRTAQAPMDPTEMLDAEVRAAGPNLTQVQLQAFSQRLKAAKGMPAVPAPATHPQFPGFTVGK